jgi:hypothetical protein
MWTAYFQSNKEPRYTIATGKFRGVVDAAADAFKARIPNPEVGIWWVWLEGDCDEVHH